MAQTAAEVKSDLETKYPDQLKAKYGKPTVSIKEIGLAVRRPSLRGGNEINQTVDEVAEKLGLIESNSPKSGKIKAKSAAENLKIPVEEVLRLAERPDGTPNSLVFLDQVEAAWQREKDQAIIDEMEPASTAVAVIESHAYRRRVTSDTRRTRSSDKPVLGEIFSDLMGYWDWEINGPYRPEMRPVLKDPLNPDSGVSYYEYDNPLRPGLPVRVGQAEYMKFMAHPTESADILTDAIVKTNIDRLSGLSFVTHVCGLCQRQMDPLLLDKFYKLLDMRFMLRGYEKQTKRYVSAVLTKRGYSSKEIKEFIKRLRPLMWRTNHTECNYLAESMVRILEEMADRDFDDEAVVDEFANKAVEASRQVFEAMRTDPQLNQFRWVKDLSRELLRDRAGDIVAALVEGTIK